VACPTTNNRQLIHYYQSGMLTRRRLISLDGTGHGPALECVALSIFIGLANKAVRENAEAIKQGSGR
jgi:hypothetical protein